VEPTRTLLVIATSSDMRVGPGRTSVPAFLDIKKTVSGLGLVSVSATPGPVRAVPLPHGPTPVPLALTPVTGPRTLSSPRAQTPHASPSMEDVFGGSTDANETAHRGGYTTAG